MKDQTYFAELPGRIKSTAIRDRLLRANVLTARKQFVASREELSYLRRLCSIIPTSGEKAFYKAVYQVGRMLRKIHYAFDTCVYNLLSCLKRKGLYNRIQTTKMVNMLLAGLDDSLKADGLPTTLEATA